MMLTSEMLVQKVCDRKDLEKICNEESISRSSVRTSTLRESLDLGIERSFSELLKLNLNHREIVSVKFEELFLDRSLSWFKVEQHPFASCPALTNVQALQDHSPQHSLIILVLTMSECWSAPLKPPHEAVNPLPS